MQPFTDGEFEKECLITVVGTVCPKKKQFFENISLSAHSVTREIENTSSDVKEKLKSGMGNFE